MISVSDTGIGIPDKDQLNIFSEFVQSETTLTRRFGGAGLGLAISKKLVEIMGGSIDLNSSVGVGSTFLIKIPLRPNFHEKNNSDKDSEQIHDNLTRIADDKNHKILVAEDNLYNQEVLKSIFSHLSVSVTYVNNGDEAVKAWEGQNEWLLVFMDIRMPVMNGIDATKNIRAIELRNGAPRTPIYALTADAMDHQKLEYLAAGIDGHISKPIRVTELFELISELSDAKPI